MSCGLDLSDPRLAEVFTLSTQSADLLTQRGRLLLELRAQQDAAVAEDAEASAETQDASPAKHDEPAAADSPSTASSMPPLPPILPQTPDASAPVPAPTISQRPNTSPSIAGAWVNRELPSTSAPTASAPAASRPPEHKRSGVQLAMLITGIAFLAVAATVFVTVAFVFFDLTVKAILTAAITAGVIALASWLQHRGLRATAEGVAALGIVLLVLDSWAIPALGLFGLDGVNPELYWGVALLLLSSINLAWWRWTRLTAPMIAASLMQLPALLLLAVWAAHAALDTKSGWVLALGATALASQATVRIWRRMHPEDHRPTSWPEGITVGLGILAAGVIPLAVGFGVVFGGAQVANLLGLALAIAAVVFTMKWALDASARLGFAYVCASLGSILVLAFGQQLGVAVLGSLPTPVSRSPHDLGFIAFSFALPLLLMVLALCQAALRMRPPRRTVALVGAISTGAMLVIPITAVLVLVTQAVWKHRLSDTNAPATLELLLVSALAALACCVPLVWARMRPAALAPKQLLPWCAAAGTFLAIVSVSLPGTSSRASLYTVATLACAGIVIGRFVDSERARYLKAGASAALITTAVLAQFFFAAGSVVIPMLFASVSIVLLVARLLRPERGDALLTSLAIAIGVFAWGNLVFQLSFFTRAEVASDLWIRIITLLVLAAAFLVVGAAGDLARLPRAAAVGFASTGLLVAISNQPVLFMVWIDQLPWFEEAQSAALFVTAGAVVAAAVIGARRNSSEQHDRAGAAIALMALVPILTSATSYLGMWFERLVDVMPGLWLPLATVAIFATTLLVRKLTVSRVPTAPTEYFALLPLAIGLVRTIAGANVGGATPWIAFALLCAAPLLARVQPGGSSLGWPTVAPWLSAGLLAVFGPAFIAATFFVHGEPSPPAIAVASPTLIAIAAVFGVAVVRRHRYRLAAAQMSIALAAALTIATLALLNDWHLAAIPFVTLAVGVAAVAMAFAVPKRVTWQWPRTVGASVGGMTMQLAVTSIALQSLNHLDTNGPIVGWLAATVFGVAACVGMLAAVMPVALVLQRGDAAQYSLHATVLRAVWIAALLTAANAQFGVALANARPVDALMVGFGLVVAVGIIAKLSAEVHGRLVAPYALQLIWLGLALIAGGSYVVTTTSTAHTLGTVFVPLGFALLALSTTQLTPTLRRLLPIAAWLVLTSIPLHLTELGSWWPVIAAAIPAIALAAWTAMRFRRDADATASLDLCAVVLPLTVATLTFDADRVQLGLLLTALAALVCAFGMTLPRPRTRNGVIARISTALLTAVAFVWLLGLPEVLWEAVLGGALIALFFVGAWMLVARVSEASTPPERAVYAAAAPIGFWLATTLAFAEHPVAAGVLAIIAAAVAVGLSALAVRHERRDLLWCAFGTAGVALWAASFALVDRVTAADAWIVQPLCLAAIAIGAIFMRAYPNLRSWPVLGITIMISLGVALTAEHVDPTWWRIGLTTVLIVAAILAGALGRLQAPLLIGVAAAVIHIIVMWRMLLPELAIPWWAWLATAGILLVFVAATYEARMRNAKRLAHSIRQLR